MLKSTWCTGERRALHSTTLVVTASSSATRTSKRATPAMVPTALTEIEPSSTWIAIACPIATSTVIATIPRQSTCP